jgi:hypothetical protein
MSQTQIRGNTQIKVNSIDRIKLVLDFLGGVDWDITNGIGNATITGLKDGVNPRDAVNVQQLQVAVSGLSGGLEYKGSLDASAIGTTLDNAEKGDFYVIGTAGVIAGIDFQVGDHLIINKDVVGTPTAVDIEKIDNSEALDIIRAANVVDNLTSTSSTDVLSAGQGKILKDLIDALSAQVHTKVYGEAPTVTTGLAVVSATNNLPIMGTLRVYLNGLRMAEGAGCDYTVNYSTGVITFEYPLQANDYVAVDYEF